MSLPLEGFKHLIEPVRDPRFDGWLEHPDVLHVVRVQDAEGRKQSVTIGSVHVADPDMWYYKVGSELFDAWRRETQGRPRVMVVEGSQTAQKRYGRTADESIRRYHSELGLLNFWSDQYGIPVLPGEPPGYQELSILLKRAEEGWYTADDVLFYYGSRELPVWYRMAHPKPELSVYMTAVMALYQRQLRLEGGAALEHDFSYAAYEQLHRDRLGFLPQSNPKRVDPATGLELETLYLQLTTAFARPDQPATAMTRVSRHCLDIRDRFKALQWWKLWHLRGRSVFKWEGLHHTLATARIYTRTARLRLDEPPGGAYVLAQDQHIGQLLAPTVASA